MSRQREAGGGRAGRGRQGRQGEAGSVRQHNHLAQAKREAATEAGVVARQTIATIRAQSALIEIEILWQAAIEQQQQQR